MRKEEAGGTLPRFHMIMVLCVNEGMGRRAPRGNSEPRSLLHAENRARSKQSAPQMFAETDNRKGKHDADSITYITCYCAYRIYLFLLPNESRKTGAGEEAQPIQ